MLKWQSIEPAWRECFEQAWEAYCCGSIPIGSVVTDASGAIIARGRNRIGDPEAPKGQICSGPLAHAELNALLQLDRRSHHVRSCTLWTTLEPCPLCFGALYMSGVRTLRYAARDRYAGSTNLCGATGYLKRKSLTILGPETELELLQMVIKTDYLLRYAPGEMTEMLLAAYVLDCPDGVALGRRWFADGILPQERQKGTPIGVIAERIWARVDKEERAKWETMT